MIGETTEVDKNSNCSYFGSADAYDPEFCRYGIGEKEEQAAAESQKKGVITLKAKNEGGKVFLSVSDDGKGMDFGQAVCKSKKERADPAGKNAERYTRRFISLLHIRDFQRKKGYRVIWQGVGMDVVVKNIQSVGGQLDIDSER